MHLTIRFGLDLDGYRSPVPVTQSGTVTLGPLGLLDQLETRLGLRVTRRGEAPRVTRYLKCLREADGGERFYSRSLAVDALAVARTLLGWRDAWIEAGWDGTAEDDDPPRVRDLAAVEELAHVNLPAGIPDRLRRVAERLAEVRLPLQVELVDPQDDFPTLWQRILDRLDVTAPVAASLPRSPEGSDLTRLQKGLLNNEACTLSGDGSVLLLTAKDNRLPGRVLSRIGHGGLTAVSCCAEPLTTQVVSDHSLSDLDLSLWSEDRPVTGSSAASPWRPPLQLLPLALNLFWEPLDPACLLQFLSHPIGPIPARARHRLAEVVAEAPGIGGQLWQEKLDELCAEAVTRAEGDAKAGAELRERVATWLEIPRHDPKTGAPLTLLAEHCARLARWLSARAELGDSPREMQTLYRAAATQAREAQLALDDWRSGAEHISRLQLERLLEEVTSAGTPIPELCAEAGALATLRAPGAAVETVPRLVWWDFTEPPLPGRLPWSETEQAALCRHGARFLTPEQQLDSLRRRWLRPLLAAERQLVLLRPEHRAGQLAPLHPLGNLILALVGRSLPTVDLAAELAGRPGPLQVGMALREQPRETLPPLRRWWHFDRPDYLTGREEESFSSLEAFLFSPYQWLLKYKAGLRGGALAALDDGNRLKGNLFHRLFETLLGDPAFAWQSLDDSAIQAATTATLDRLLPEEGAVFLLPGRRREKQALYDIARRSVLGLLRRLRAAGVVETRLEEKNTGHFTGGKLAGTIDLRVTNAQGREAVIDLKWGGGKYKIAELRENRALQLALYAYLRKKAGRWPAQAFYILSEGRLLAQNRDYFPDATVCAPEDENAHAGTLWVEFEKAWKWRREQFDRGLVEVTVTGTSADADSTPEGALTIPETSDKFNDFRSLTGWKEGA